MRILLPLLLAICVLTAKADEQALRVFIRAGVKTHGPGQHDHPRFLADWKQLLNERGLKADGAMKFPTATQLENTDVLVIFAADGMKIVGQDRANFEKFLQRGGGFVVVHDAVVSDDQHEWAKKVQGGAWIWPKNAPGKTATKWHEGEVGIYFVDTKHPITKGISNFDWQDEIYYDLDMAPDVHVLATSFHSVFVIAPQLWTYEKTWEGGSKPYRAFVTIPGHEYTSFSTPQYRAILMRGIAWAGHRENVDEFCKQEELASLTYPPGGPRAPAKEVQKLNVDPEFNINLVASEPLIEKAISMDWDPQGRLWVAETPEYPNGRTVNDNDRLITAAKEAGFHIKTDKNKVRKVDRPAKDRISWLEDTDGDGVMDKKHVFYEGLELVTSLVFCKDGVIVAQAPDILWIRDTDGDGKADKVETLFTGFGTSDTHAVINNFRWGMDGWVYGACGYSGGHPKSADGSLDFGPHASAIFRFKPDGKAFEVLASTSCNTWGFDFNWDNEMFYSTPTCGDHVLHIVLPERILARGSVGNIKAQNAIQDHTRVKPAVHHTRPAYVQIDVVGGFTAAAGACLYTGGAWPEKYNNTYFVNEPTVSLVHQDFLTPKSTTYVASKEPGREETEFLTGSDLWFRPIHTRVGPDGALYLIDFYNQAVIHNDTRGPKHGANNAATRPDRDHHLGRIWRIQHKQAKPLPPVSIDPRDAQTLVKALEHPNGWTRMTAQRLLFEKNDTAVAPTLAKLLQTSDSPATRIHALWALNNLGKMDEVVTLAALQDKSSAVRKNALRAVAENDSNQGDSKLNAIRAELNDDDARVKLQALVALQTFQPSADVAKAVVNAWPMLGDRYLESAAIGAAARDPLLYAQTILGANAGTAHDGFIRYIVRQMAQKGDVNQAARLLGILVSAPASADSQKQVALESLAENLKAGNVPEWNAELESALKALLNSANPGIAGAALPLAARWDKSGVLKAEFKP
ncbi:MAG TPA: PVC-type heme-binding CxxCH protein, partial [Verrucomicrobiae bacterium]